jgi:hypothetical protein
VTIFLSYGGEQEYTSSETFILEFPKDPGGNDPLGRIGWLVPMGILIVVVAIAGLFTKRMIAIGEKNNSV